MLLLSCLLAYLVPVLSLADACCLRLLAASAAGRRICANSVVGRAMKKPRALRARKACCFPCLKHHFLTEEDRSGTLSLPDANAVVDHRRHGDAATISGEDVDEQGLQL